MSPRLYKLGRWCASHRWQTLGLWLAITALVVFANQQFGAELNDDFATPGLDSYEAQQLLEREFTSDSGITAQVVVQAPAGTTLSGADQSSALATLEGALQRWEHTADVQPPQAGSTISNDGTIGLLLVNLKAEAPISSSTIHELEELVDATTARFDGDQTLRVELGGDLYFLGAEPETGVGEMLGIFTAIVVLLLAFGSVVAMSLPLAVAIFGLALGLFGVIGLAALALAVPSFAPQTMTMVGLGVGIDYALFVLTRYREGRGSGLTLLDAVGRAVATAGQSVIFAGGTVVVAILGLSVVGLPFLTAAGVSVSVIVGIMVLASITLLPALLGFAGNKVDSRRSRRAREAHLAELAVGSSTNGAALNDTGAGDADGGTSAPANGQPDARAAGHHQVTVSGRWQRWGAHISRYAWHYLIGSVALLVALALPVFWLQLGFPDQGNDDPNTTTRQAYDLVAEGFGPGFNGPLVVVVDTAVVPQAEVEALATAITADSSIAQTQPVNYAPSGGAAIIVSYPDSAPQDRESIATLNRLRDDIFPAVLTDPSAAHVGGVTASFNDMADHLSKRMLLFVLAVVAVSFVLLTMLFRSLLVPLKAAVLNLLSIGAAYGVLVMVFQWGWGAALVGLAEPVPIVSFIPMFMFALLFGLSMDYEVFLLSRVKEEYLASGNNTASVTAGIASTARVITSAALIMIAVFGGFVLNVDPILKMMGLGLAVAIFVDASVVRMILVPATMKLMGNANWWFPRWLEWLPRLDIEGERRLPARELELVAVGGGAGSGSGSGAAAADGSNAAAGSAGSETKELPESAPVD